MSAQGGRHGQGVYHGFVGDKAFRLLTEPGDGRGIEPVIAIGAVPDGHKAGEGFRGRERGQSFAGGHSLRRHGQRELEVDPLIERHMLLRRLHGQGSMDMFWHPEVQLPAKRAFTQRRGNVLT